MAWYDSNWQYRRKITIDSSKIDSDLTNFPILVKLTSANFDFSKAKSDGTDIRFTASDGTTLLKYERERHDSTNNVAEYWVKIPSISSSTDTDFYIYYGNSDAADGEDATNVWDSNFVGVWHLNEASNSTLYDSTGNNNNSNTNTLDSVAGQVAGGMNNDGSEGATVPDSTSLDITGALTISAIIKPQSSWSAATARLVSKNNWSPAAGYGFFFAIDSAGSVSDAYLRFNIDGNDYSHFGPTGWFASEWNYVAVTYNPSTETVLYKLDGNDTSLVTDSNTTSVPSSITTNNVALNFAAQGGSSGFFKDDIDEIRISNTNRGSAWIKAEAFAVFDKLNTYGTEETPTAAEDALFFGVNF